MLTSGLARTRACLCLFFAKVGADAGASERTIRLVYASRLPACTNACADALAPDRGPRGLREEER